MCFWKYLGYHMIFFNAGLLSINEELYAAADIDGATEFTKFTKITVPMLRPITEFLLVMNIIWGFNFLTNPRCFFQTGPPWEDRCPRQAVPSARRSLPCGISTTPR
jgi:ABC-type sugar transport system permease subunit